MRDSASTRAQRQQPGCVWTSTRARLRTQSSRALDHRHHVVLCPSTRARTKAGDNDGRVRELRFNSRPTDALVWIPPVPVPSTRLDYGWQSSWRSSRPPTSCACSFNSCSTAQSRVRTGARASPKAKFLRDTPSTRARLRRCSRGRVRASNSRVRLRKAVGHRVGLGQTFQLEALQLGLDYRGSRAHGCRADRDDPIASTRARPQRQSSPVVG